MANQQPREWFDDFVILDGWHTMDCFGDDVAAFKISENHDLCVSEGGQIWIEGALSDPPLIVAQFSEERLAEAFYHAESVANAFKTAQSASEEENG